jgi:hypothetical protein
MVQIPMSDNENVMELHGCIVCGRLYEILVVYDPDNRLVDCLVISPGGRVVPDPERPLVACERHPEEKVKTALANHYPGKAVEDLEDELEDD